ncbi:hypothetical protein P7H74_03460 [Enterococcus devriesei]|uniref:hypothetical protein n=1 Tax=Enterococcus devriesei TaxID=319970 RepID=UPI00288E09F4|nr:hypothetical protein [Enterococcus devriesei]MDT2820801.1 hypothetical protein [Enterococcus devriesei]
MRLAFVAWTPLHIINILNVYRNYYPGAEADLFIYSEFESAEKYYSSLKNLSVFSEVFLVDHKKIGTAITRKINLLTNKNRFFMEKIHPYDEIFIQGENYFSKILFSNIKKENTKVKLNYIEDGIGTYLERTLFSTSERIQKIINKWNQYSIFLQDIANYYVYCPELLIEEPNKVRKIPKIKEHSSLSNELIEIFGIEEIDIENKYLFFDQPLLYDGYGVNESEIAEKIFEILPKSKEMVIKIHPRGKLDRYGSNKVLNSSLPFEILLAENSFNSSVLISPISTISFSPSMMFDKRVESILLVELLLNEYPDISESKRTILEKISLFCIKYNEISGSKILLPSSWDELRKLVN